MRRFLFLLSLLLITPSLFSQAGAAQDYLYERDVTVPAYQTLREFFDMPNRSGHYDVTLLSDAIGPLTFRVIRVRGDHESVLGRKRSYRVGSHDFQQRFDNEHGEDDVMIEIANSNPAAKARVTVYVAELP